MILLCLVHCFYKFYTNLIFYFQQSSLFNLPLLYCGSIHIMGTVKHIDTKDTCTHNIGVLHGTTLFSNVYKNLLLSYQQSSLFINNIHFCCVAIFIL